MSVNSMRQIRLADLTDWATRILENVGLSNKDAYIVADSLRFAESRGIPSHGFLRLDTYINRITNGGINSLGTNSIVADLGALVIVDSHQGPGASTAHNATALAIERAEKNGIGCVIARNANHFGCSAYFTNQIADAGYFGLVACNTESVMCSPFGGRPILGTNPIAMAAPLVYEYRAQLDMATTTVSQGKLILAEQSGQEIPDNWAVDNQGKKTTSPSAGLRGALLPSGGFKGFGLAFSIDAMLAIAGAKTSPEISPLDGNPSTPQELGQIFIAIKVDAVQSVEDYQNHLGGLISAIHLSGIIESNEIPLAPGEPEIQRELASNGELALTSQLARQLEKIATEFHSKLTF